MNRWIGFGVLWPWLRYRFASSRMYPRFDPEGRIYMLLCEQPIPDKVRRIVQTEPKGGYAE